MILRQQQLSQNFTITTMPRALYVIILVFTLNTYLVTAYPVHHELMEARDNADNSNKPEFISPKAWIPIVVVILLLCIGALMTWSKDAMLKTVTVFGAYGSSNVGAPSSTGAARQLTTEELVGSTTDLPTSETPTPARRTRRPRRTPSQMSVTSLPAYNKEPGEEELVIFRGRDTEDEPMLGAARAALPADEDDDHSRVSRYSVLPRTSNDMPLLHNDGPSGDLSSQSLWASNMRPSFDNQETSSLLRTDNNLPQEPSDQAPPYFEAVDHDSGVPTTQTTSSSAEPQRPRKTSGFLSFLNRMTMMSPTHRRMESDQSAASLISHERSTPSRTSNHNRTSSSMSFLRPISDQGSSTGSRINSPSLISLNPISAPLSHTLVRTEFTYPKSGPTPEQLKVISSRENFSRFSMPYGADAIAFAASSSRQDLDPPPPDFEEASSSSRRSSDPPRPQSSISQSTSGEGAEHTTPSSQPTQSENVSNTSIHTESSTSSHSKDPNPISPAVPFPSASSSTSNPAPPLLLPSINIVSEFGNLYTSPTSPTSQNATGFTAHSESGASNYSFQSYATAAESLPPEKNISLDSRSSTPRLGDQHVSTATSEVLVTTAG